MKVHMASRILFNSPFAVFALFFSLSFINSGTAGPTGPMPFHDPDPRSDSNEGEIPTEPSAPPVLAQKVFQDTPHCQRYFLFKGEKIECDSNIFKDVERLRSIVKDVPDALAELDTYRSNQKKIQFTAYLGTAGFLTALTGIIISRPPFDPVNGSPKPGGYLLLGGLGLAIHSLIYGFGLMKANEAHIPQAVQYYNQVHPEQPIELEFSTSLSF